MKQPQSLRILIAFMGTIMVLSISSCNTSIYEALTLNPYQYYLNEDQDSLSAISLYNMGSLDQFFRTGNNAFEVKDEGKVALGFYKDTQHEFDISVRPIVMDNKAAELSFHSRMVSENYKKGYGIECRFTQQGCVVSEGGTIFYANPDAKLESGKQYRFRIINDGAFVYAYLDCDLLFQKKTKLPLTEQFVIEHRKGTSATYEGVFYKRVDTDIDPLIRARESFDYEELLNDVKGIFGN
jgi:hypothetical protein